MRRLGSLVPRPVCHLWLHERTQRATCAAISTATKPLGYAGLRPMQEFAVMRRVPCLVEMEALQSESTVFLSLVEGKFSQNRSDIMTLLTRMIQPQ